MKKYNVEIVETLSKIVEVDAIDYADAKEKVSEMYDNEEIVLDWEDLESTDYKPYPNLNLKNNLFICIDYNRDDNLLYIKFNNDVIEYKCKNIEDALFSIKNYMQNNMNIEYFNDEKEMER